MKSGKGRGLMGVAAIVGMILVISAVPMFAQSKGLKVTIPFAFHAGAKAMPAGMYTVERIGEAIRISDGKGNASAVLSNAVKNETPKLGNALVFNRYGEDRFLSEVRWEGYSAARGLPKSTTERRLAKALGTGGEAVTVAAIRD